MIYLYYLFQRFYFCARKRITPTGSRSELREANTSSPRETVIIGGADMRVKVTLACTECKQRNYVSKKNKKNDPERIEMNKHCKFCKKHTLHRETK